MELSKGPEQRGGVSEQSCFRKLGKVALELEGQARGCDSCLEKRHC